MSARLQFLTIWQLLYRKTIDVLYSFHTHTPDAPDDNVRGYRLHNSLTKMSSGTQSMMGTFHHARTKKIVFIKKYSFKTRGLRYASLLNEVSVLTLLKRNKLVSFPEQDVIIPTLIRTFEKDNVITLICEYKPGKPLLTFDEQTKKDSLLRALETLQVISQKLRSQLKFLPKRPNALLASVFPYFALKATLKSPEFLERNLKLCFIFYRHYFATLFDTNIYSLAHRDLHSRNLMLDKKTLILTDWEGATVMDATYDVAMIGRLYGTEFSLDTFLYIYDKRLKTISEKKRFIFLTIFHSLQTLAVDDKNTISHPVTQRYLNMLLSDIIPRLMNADVAK